MERSFSVRGLTHVWENKDVKLNSWSCYGLRAFAFVVVDIQFEGKEGEGS